MWKSKVIYSLALFGLTACSAGSGGSSSNSGDGGSADNPTNPASVGAPITINGSTYSISHDGRTYSSNIQYQIDPNIPKLAVVNDDYNKDMYIALSGHHVDIFGHSLLSHVNPAASGAAWGLTGDMTTVIPNTGSQQYNGHYILTNPNDPDKLIVENEIVLTVNFDAATLSGSTVNALENEMADFTGHINGQLFSLIITDYLGTHHAEGGFFGPNAEELGAGFAEEQIVGIVYGTTR